MFSFGCARSGPGIRGSCHRCRRSRRSRHIFRWRHVGDGGTICERQVGWTPWPLVEFHETGPPHATSRSDLHTGQLPDRSRSRLRPSRLRVRSRPLRGSASTPAGPALRLPASIPPTPQPSTPEAVDHGGVAVGAPRRYRDRPPSPPVRPFRRPHRPARICSRFLPDGRSRCARAATAEKFRKLLEPHFRKFVTLGIALIFERHVWLPSPWGWPNSSTITEWSITRLTGTSGLILAVIAAQRSLIASRIRRPDRPRKARR